MKTIVDNEGVTQLLQESQIILNLRNHLVTASDLCYLGAGVLAGCAVAACLFLIARRFRRSVVSPESAVAMSPNGKALLALLRSDDLWEIQDYSEHRTLQLISETLVVCFRPTISPEVFAGKITIISDGVSCTECFSSEDWHELFTAIKWLNSVLDWKKKATDRIGDDKKAAEVMKSVRLVELADRVFAEKAKRGL